MSNNDIYNIYLDFHNKETIKHCIEYIFINKLIDPTHE